MTYSSDRMKNHTAGTVPKYNRTIIETEVTSIPLTHTYMIAHIPGLA